MQTPYLTEPGERLRQLAESHLRLPARFYNLDGTDVLEFDPPLTTAEQTTYELLQRIAATMIPMTTDQYNAVRSQMQGLRDLRQMGRNAFMALSAAERDRLTYDALTDVTIVLLALLRD